MKAEMILTLLTLFSTLNGLVVETIKKIVSDKYTLPYNLIAVITALIVGTGGTFAFYIVKAIDINLVNSIYAVAIGFLSALTSMVGYDKVKQLIEQMRL